MKFPDAINEEAMRRADMASEIEKLERARPYMEAEGRLAVLEELEKWVEKMKFGLGEIQKKRDALFNATEYDIRKVRAELLTLYDVQERETKNEIAALRDAMEQHLLEKKYHTGEMS